MTLSPVKWRAECLGCEQLPTSDNEESLTQVVNNLFDDDADDDADGADDDKGLPDEVCHEHPY